VWRNLLLDRYGEAGWRLSIDADETVVYPGWPALKLDGFAASMRAAGRQVVNSIMLDMYGPGPVLTCHPGQDGDLLTACPLFDGNGYTIEPPADWRQERFPRLNIRGGPEMRAIRPRPAFGWLAKIALVLEPGILYRDPHTVYPFELNFDAPRMALLHFRFCSAIAPSSRGFASAGRLPEPWRPMTRWRRDCRPSRPFHLPTRGRWNFAPRSSWSTRG